MVKATCSHSTLYCCRACLEYGERSPDTRRRHRERQRFVRPMAAAQRETLEVDRLMFRLRFGIHPMVLNGILCP